MEKYTAYRLWLFNEGLRTEGFYEVKTLDELFQFVENFKKYGRYKGRRAYFTIEQTMIEHQCDICSLKENDIKYTVDLGVYE